MKKTTRFLALLLATVMVLALAACGGNAPAASAEASAASEASAPAPEVKPDEPEDEAPQVDEEEPASTLEDSAEETVVPEVVVEYPLFDETHTYTIWLGTAPDLSDVVSDMSQFVIFRELEKITNVTWDATMVSFMAEAEQFQLMVAGGEYTDVISKAVDNYTGTVDQAIEEDFLIDLAPYISENMPNLSAKFQEYPDLLRQIKSDGGAIGAFPKIYAAPSDISSGGSIRADWLEDLGLAEPKTYDDLYNILREFKEKKGADKPLIISRATGVQPELLNGYNVGAGFYQVDGEIRYGVVQPEFKEFLTMMNKWYSEGLINDLFLSQGSYESLMDASPILNGSCGVWYGTSAQTYTNVISQSTDPNMKITGVTNVTTDGSMAHLGEEGSMFDSHLWSVTTACEDPEIICQYIDYVYSEEGTLLANYGVEGETFTYVDGVPTLTDLVLNNPDYSYGAAMNIFVCDRMTPAPFVIDEARVRANYVEDQLNAIAVWNNSNDGLYNLPRTGVNMNVEESEEYNSLYSDIETYMDEHIVKFIVGDEPLSDFDSFVETLHSMGIDRCIELEQSAYDRYMAS
ncbi:MAG: extracellular solute-binding protein [Oscillospiraceae bacterium]|nr:extracellular solute-binding protein [Oscillospiraceae bacterium]